MNIDLASLGALAIVGAAITAFVQFVKATVKLNATGLRLLTIGLSLAGATAYWFIKDTNILPIFVSILGLANSLYLFIIKPLENSDKLPDSPVDYE